MTNFRPLGSHEGVGRERVVVDDPMLPSLAAASYPFANCYFNTAAVALVSGEAEAAIERGSLDWQAALESARMRFAGLFRRPVEFVTIFHNSTSAAQRVLLRIAQLMDFDRAMLLTTDLEYPGSIAMIDNFWRGPMAIVELAKLAWGGRLADITLALKQAILLTRPRVVFVSHIARSLGYPLLDETILEFLRDIVRETIVIVDGAQALGNIKVSERILELSDFYVAGAHKWLCCPPTLGVVCAHPRWQVADPAQSYSRLYGSGGTGQISVLRSAVEALETFCGDVGSYSGVATRIAQHNSSLAQLFCTSLGAQKLPLAPLSTGNGYWGASHWPLNGIVVTRMASGVSNHVIDTSCDVQRISELAAQGKVMATRLRAEQWTMPGQGKAPGPRLLVRPSSDAVVPENVDLRADRLYAPVPPDGVFRFCFHYYHSSADVQNLISRLRGGFASGPNA